MALANNFKIEKLQELKKEKRFIVGIKKKQVHTLSMNFSHGSAQLQFVVKIWEHRENLGVVLTFKYY